MQPPSERYAVEEDAVTRKLAEVLAGARYADLPPGAVEDTQRSILDWLGSALTGAVEPPARMAQRVVASLGTSAEATIFAAGRSSAAGAALANGVASHILELDDIHKGSTVHAAAPIIPAALVDWTDGQTNTGIRLFICTSRLSSSMGFRMYESQNS